MQQLQLQQAQIQREQARINEFWNDVGREMAQIDPEKEDFKTHELPLARIKKIMRLEDDIAEAGAPRFMIAAEAPIIIAKACEIFVLEMAMRACSLTAENKRRTLQRNDIAMAVAKTDTYDFLIDIVPRDELKKAEMGQAQPSAADLEAQQQMQLLAMQHALGQQMQEQQQLQLQQAVGAAAEGAGAAAGGDAMAAQAALQQQALMQADPQLAMQVLWQQHAQQAMFVQQQQGAAAAAAAADPNMEQANALAAMQSALMANPAMLQAIVANAGQPQAPPQQQQQQQQQPQQQQQQVQQQQQQQQLMHQQQAQQQQQQQQQILQRQQNQQHQLAQHQQQQAQHQQQQAMGLPPTNPQ
eukprot:g13465.t2